MNNVGNKNIAQGFKPNFDNITRSCFSCRVVLFAAHRFLDTRYRPTRHISDGRGNGSLNVFSQQPMGTRRNLGAQEHTATQLLLKGGCADSIRHSHQTPSTVLYLQLYITVCLDCGFNSHGIPYSCR